MKGKYNLKTVSTGLGIIILGILSVLADIFWLKTNQNIWISIGCSLLASGIVILAQAVLIEGKRIDPLDEWGLEKIYETRAEKNKESDSELEKAKEQVDAIAFGLKSFRTKHTNKVRKILRNGVNIRILTMNPDKDNIFLKQREIEEEETEGQIRNSIEQLVDWANKLNSESHKGKIEVKGYKCMTLDFYWRVDNDIYIGPYWYHSGSQQTITYKFHKGRRGFDTYKEYFENLWNDEGNTIKLTE